MISQQNLGRMRENLYEIPVCSICLLDLSEEIMALPCGHCFHDECIAEHLQYQFRCPNCMIDCGIEEPMKIHFNVIKKDDSREFLVNFIKSLEEEESKQQIETLLEEVVQIKANEQKNREELEQCKAKLQTAKERSKDIQAMCTAKLKNAEEKIKQMVDQCSRRGKRITVLNNQLASLSSDFENREATVRRLQKSQMKLRLDIQKYHALNKKYQDFKNYDKLLYENSTEIKNYKIRLESQGVNSEEMVKIFYDMLMMSNLRCKKLKEESQGAGEKLVSKDIELSKLKNTVAELYVELREMRQKKVEQRRKYQQLKANFRKLSEKAQVKEVNEIPQLENSQGFSNLFKSQSVIGKTEARFDVNLKQLKKPLFSSGSTIGGLKKKEGRI